MTGRGTPRGPAVLTAVFATALFLSGCTTGSPDHSEDKTSMPTATQEQATAQITRYATQTQQAVGAGPLLNPTVTAGPCQNPTGDFSDPDQLFTVLGVYQVTLPAQQHRAVLRRISQQWNQNGWTTTYRDLAGTQRAEVTARNPHDNYEITLTSTAPPQAIRVSVFSPCYQRPSSAAS